MLTLSFMLPAMPRYAADAAAHYCRHVHAARRHAAATSPVIARSSADDDALLPTRGILARC